MSQKIMGVPAIYIDEELVRQRETARPPGAGVRRIESPSQRHVSYADAGVDVDERGPCR